jgi:hypothetical protein
MRLVKTEVFEQVYLRNYKKIRFMRRKRLLRKLERKARFLTAEKRGLRRVRVAEYRLDGMKTGGA